MKKRASHHSAVPALTVDENVSLEEQIAKRAHELWHQGHREHGHDLSHWFRAENEVKEWHRLRLNIADSSQASPR